MPLIDRSPGRAAFKQISGCLSAVLVVVCWLTLNAQAQPGSLDPSFDPGDGPNGVVRYLALAPDGKVLIGGGFTEVNGHFRTHLARLHPDGQLDLDFHPVFQMQNWSPKAVDPMVEPAGTILVQGLFTHVNGVARSLARLRPDGTLEPAFDPLIQTIHRVQWDGKILAGSLVRLFPDGTLDSSFAADLGHDPLYPQVSCREVVVQSDDKLVVLVTRHDPKFSYRTDLVRLHPDGSRDAGFPSAGQAIDIHFDFLLPLPRQQRLAVQTDDKILIAGSEEGAGQSLIRLNPDGSQDPTFRPVSLPPNDVGPTPFISAFLVQPNGKIVIGGNFTAVNGIPRQNIARLTREGEMDLEFDAGDFSGPWFGFSTHALALQPDGKIMFGGAFTGVNGVVRPNLARVEGDDFTQSPPFILRQPRNQTVLERQPVVMRVETFNAYSEDFQWEFQGVPIPRATNSVFQIDSAELDQQGDYRVAVSNAAGISLSQSAMLTVISGQAPEILSQTADLEVIEGNPVFLSVEADPQTHPLEFQWHFNGQLLPGETNAVLNLLAGLASDAGTYHVAVSNEFGSVASDPATLTVIPRPGNFEVSYLPPGGTDGSVKAIKALPNGTFLIGGAFQKAGRRSDPFLAALHPDGTRDLTFMPGPAEAFADWQWVEQIELAPDGRIFILARVEAEGRSYAAKLLKLNSDGAIDSQFEEQRISTSTWPNFKPETHVRFRLQPDGRILVARDSASINNIIHDAELFRLLPNGRQDVFSLWFENYPAVSMPAFIHDLDLDSSGRIYVLGDFTRMNGTAASRLARLSGTGALDDWFVVVDPVKGPFLQAPMAVQSNGKVLLLEIDSSQVGQFRLIRFNLDGSRDTSFTPVPFDGPVAGMTPLPDDRLLVWGEFSTINQIARKALARLHPDGELDLWFYPIRDLEGTLAAVALNGEGTVCIGGNFSQVNGIPRRNLALIKPFPALQLLRPALSQGALNVEFPGVAGRSYLVETSNTVPQPAFADPTVVTEWDFHSRIEGKNEIERISIPATARQKFLRVRMEPPYNH